MGKKFILYGLIGWCAEVFWTGLGSLMKGDVKLTSFTYIWMFPIYGLAVFLEVVHNRIRHMNVIVRGTIYMLIIFTAEYSTGLLLRTALGICPWDYSRDAYSINGLIRLDFIPVWFSAGLLFEKIHDMIDRIGVTLKLN